MRPAPPVYIVQRGHIIDVLHRRPANRDPELPHPLDRYLVRKDCVAGSELDQRISLKYTEGFATYPVAFFEDRNVIAAGITQKFSQRQPGWSGSDYRDPLFWLRHDRRSPVNLLLMNILLQFKGAANKSPMQIGT
jgi:hypothetical protein